MKNYFNADWKRIHRKGLHYILLGAFFLLLVIVAFVKASKGASSYAGFTDLASVALSMFLGVLMFFEVFADDTKTRTMQIAIGKGLTRTQVLLTKELEGLALTAVYFVIGAVLLSVIPLFAHTGLTAANSAAIWTSVLGAALNTILYFNIGLIFIVATLKANYAEIVFILFAFDLIPGGIDLLLGLCHTKLGLPDLLPFVYQNMVDSFLAHPMSHWGSFFGILIYLFVSFWLSARIFRKKELEF